ncbi:unnamed protein product [Brassica oleracea var. botrytis]
MCTLTVVGSSCLSFGRRRSLLLTSDVPGVRDAAIGEIAKMSVQSINLESNPSRSMSVRGLRRRFDTSKQQVAEAKR